MGWVTLKLSYGLRLSQVNDSPACLAARIQALLPQGKEPGLLLIDLSPDVTDTESGDFKYLEAEEDFETCLQGQESFLLMYAHCSLILDESNGVSLNANRCYNGGRLEFLYGENDPDCLPTEEETKTLERIAEGLGVPFKLSFSLRAEGSSVSDDHKTWFK